MISAPSFTTRVKAARKSASVSERLAAKKLSGVTLTIAITNGWRRSYNRSPKRMYEHAESIVIFTKAYKDTKKNRFLL
jgi:hypothetical protein